MSKVLNVKVSDTTGDANRTNAGNKKMTTYICAKKVDTGKI